MPVFSFALIAGGLMYAARKARADAPSDTAEVPEEESESIEQTGKRSCSTCCLSNLQLEVGYALIPMADAKEVEKSLSVLLAFERILPVSSVL